MVGKIQSGQIPLNAGVYFFKDGKGKILYIGKANNLRARLSSYFAKTMAPKTKSMTEEAETVNWEIVNSEAEALIKEAELIKKYRPKYNILMRDDKQYFYAGFTREKYPKIFVTHQNKVNATFIGPFTEGGALRSVLKTLRRPFPYCTCKNLHERLCLNGKIGKCIGYCCLKSQRQEHITGYKKNIAAIKEILSGRNKTLSRNLKKEMQKLSDNRKYEEAGRTRDKIYALERIFEHRGVIRRDAPSDSAKALRSLESMLGIEEIKRIEAYDIANIQGKFAYGSMAVWSARGGSVLGGKIGAINKAEYRIFKIKNVSGSDDPAMIREVLSRRFKHPEWAFPDVIIIDGGKPQMSAVFRVLKLLPKAEVFQNFSQRDGARLSNLPAGKYAGLEKSAAKAKVIALTKNNKHIGDHIFLGGQKNPVSLDKLPISVKNLILNLDSEAHRFAISHYRKSHRKSLLG